MIAVPDDTLQNYVRHLRTWADCIISEDGDRDEDASSNLTCEQTLAAARIMLGVARKIEDMGNKPC